MALPAIRTEWSEEFLFDLMRLDHASEDVPQDHVDAGVRQAICSEGTVVPIGQSGKTIWIRPGLKQRLGIAERIH